MTRAGPLRTLPLALGLAAALNPLAAQSTGAVARVLTLPASARAMALGDAYPMDAGHADGLFYNPALLEGAAGFGVAVQTWSGEATSATASAAAEWFGGGVGVGLQTLQYAREPGAPDAGAGVQDDLFAPGGTPVSERVATVGYARSLFGVDVGVAARLLEQREGTARDAGILVDAGAAADVGPLRAGVAVRGLGPDLTLNGQAREIRPRVTLGAGGYGQPVGPLDLGVSAAVTWEDGTWLPGGGVEIGYWPVVGRTFIGRVGLQRTPSGDGSAVSFGAAYWGDDLVLSWAYRPFRGMVDDGSHRFEVRWR